LKVYGNLRDTIIQTIPDTVWRKYIDIPYQTMEGVMTNGNTYDFNIQGVQGQRYFIDTVFFYKFRINYTIDRTGGGGQNLSDQVVEVYAKI